jgi:hypothetical protein
VDKVLALVADGGREVRAKSFQNIPIKKEIVKIKHQFIVTVKVNNLLPSKKI